MYILLRRVSHVYPIPSYITPLYFKRILTQYVEVEWFTFAIPFGIVADTSVISRRWSGHSLKNKALVADYNSGTDVDVQKLALKPKRILPLKLRLFRATIGKQKFVACDTIALLRASQIIAKLNITIRPA